MKRSFLFQFVFILLLSGCSADDSPGEVEEEPKEVTILATIVKTGGGPCAFLIQPDEDPDTFLFGEIPETFKEDGFRVEVSYRSEGTVYSCSGFLDAKEIVVLKMNTGLGVN